MKVWIEEDSCTFEIHKTETPYGVEVEIPSDLIAQYEKATAQVGILTREIYRMMNEQLLEKMESF